MSDILFARSVDRVKRSFAVVVVFSCAINLLMLTAPLFMLQVYDRVLTSRSEDTLYVLLGMAVVALIALALLDYLRNVALARIGSWFDRELGGPVFAASVTETLRNRPGSAQALRDLGSVSSFLGGSLMVPLLDSPWTPIFLAALFLLHPVIGWLALGGAVLLFLLAVLNEAVTRRPLRAASQAQHAAFRDAETASRNADVIDSMGMMSGLIARWRGKALDAQSLQLAASSRGNAISAFSKFVRQALQIGILAVGALLVLGEEMSPGAIVAGAILLGRALAPVEQAIGAWRSGVEARAAYGRVKDLLVRAPARGEATALPAPAGALSVEGASYYHPGRQQPTLARIAFGLDAGESLGIVGPTASGKSTLARLLVGNLTPQGGHVRLDSAEISRWDADDRGRHVGYLPQDVELFDGTVRENIARFTACNDEEVVEAAMRAGAHDMILRLPGGYDAPLGDGGTAISGGQRQRIGLARALFGNPRFVVLDEPNASLDTEGEQALIDAMGRLQEDGVTVAVIAHRPNVLRRVDKVLVLGEGAMRQFGPRDEILQRIVAPAARPNVASA